ncbi:hypothetical protein SAMN06265784_105437 [Paraburkholderia susongensis]|uniref:Uncharacterized protein n=1 Tax=Paraburkholderia susongensis TaxID=1515439 RepID=A0A1X7LDH2_9BURK|nr:hypothetical protein SAMN06265784_105437 [Paraburkholderia susongensis]
MKSGSEAAMWDIQRSARKGCATEAAGALPVGAAGSDRQSFC